MQAELRQRDETLHRLEQKINQISRSNITGTASEHNVLARNELCASSNMNLGYKLKPDTFDGTGSLREIFYSI